MNEVNKRIKEAILQDGRTVGAIAKEIGVSRCAIYYWMCNKYSPTLQNAIALCETLNISLVWLAYGEEQI